MKSGCFSYFFETSKRIFLAVIASLALSMILSFAERAGRRVAQWAGLRLIIMLFLAAALLFAAPVRVQGTGQQGLSGQEAGPERMAVILMIDNSGSMKQSDPTNLRFSAARLFIALLDEADAAGVITFSTHSQALTHGLETSGSVSKASLLAIATPAPADGWTDFKAAFEMARPWVALAQQDQAAKVVILLLTDGEPQVPNSRASYQQETLQAARALGVPVMAIALTQKGQTPFLGQVVQQTGGTLTPAQSASDLLDAYLQIFSQVKDRAVLDGSGSRLELEPALAPFIERASFVLVARPGNSPAALYAPGGQAVDSMATAARLTDPAFQVVTVEHPAGGTWQFGPAVVRGAQARAILYSRLRLKISLPSPAQEAGQPMPIRLQLYEDHDSVPIQVIGQANFSALVTRPDGSQERLDRFYDDGTHGDERSGDGEYTRLYVNTDESGAYTVAVQGWKGVAPVTAVRSVAVIAAPDLVITSPLAQRYLIMGQPIRLLAHLSGGVKLEQGELWAVIRAPSGEPIETQLQQDGQQYQADFWPLEDGDYQAAFEPRSATTLGMPYTHHARIDFSVRLTPLVRFDDTPIDLGRFDLGALENGLVVTIPVTSTSRVFERVAVRWEGTPGLEMPAGAMLSIPPAQTSRLSINLQPQGTFAAGNYAGELIFSANPDIALSGQRRPLRLEVYQARIQALAGGLEVQSAAACPGLTITLNLPVSATLGAKETVSLELLLSDPALQGRLRLSPEAIAVEPGQNQATLQVLDLEQLPAGEYQARLMLRARDGLLLEPASGVPVTLVVPPPLARCKKPVTQGAILLSAGLLLAAGVIHRARLAGRLPPVSGTLRCWPESEPRRAQEIDLTALDKSEVRLGGRLDHDALLSESDVEDAYVQLRAVRQAEKVQVYLHPHGEVRAGYRLLHNAVPLQHGDAFCIARRCFEYLSDEPSD